MNIVRSSARRAVASAPRAAMSSAGSAASFKLPDLSYDYGAVSVML
jgi:hypothetical protein